MRYRNFELVIQARDPETRSYSVFAQSDDGASHLGEFSLAEEWPRLEQLCAALERRAILVRSGAAAGRSLVPRASDPRPVEDPAGELGRLLYRAGFGGKMGEVLRSSARVARSAGEGVRIRLRLQKVPELHRLPWEYLHDGEDFVATDVHAPLVRYTEKAEPARPLAVKGALRLLVVVASPTDQAALDSEAECRRLREALAEPIEDGRIVMDVLEDGRWPTLVRALSPGVGQVSYNVLHFIGHGGVDATTGSGVLLFEDADGRSVAQDTDGIATLLKNHPSLRLVVLNACQGAASNADDVGSSLAATLVTRAAPAVVAMQYAITDRAALDFAQTFYGSLARGNPVEVAMVMARVGEYTRTTSEARSLEWGTPVLYLRAPEGQLFALEPDRPHPSADAGTPPPPAPPRGRGRLWLAALLLGALSAGGLYAAFRDDGGAGKEPVPPACVPNHEKVTVRGVDFIRICPGEFVMGDAEGEEDERPAHRVRVPAFWMAISETTNAQYREVMSDSQHRKGLGSTMATSDVTWAQAQAFCRELSNETLEGRLPTEAEWEYACRAGTRSPYGVEEARLHEYAQVELDGGEPRPVMRKRPNPWGLYDMNGNVWEWVADAYRPYDAKRARGAVGSAAAVVAEPPEAPRVLRGGSGWTGRWSTRCASRGPNQFPQHGAYGFRCALEQRP